MLHLFWFRRTIRALLLFKSSMISGVQSAPYTFGAHGMGFNWQLNSMPCLSNVQVVLKPLRQ